VLLYGFVYLCICGERDTGVSHPAVIELAELWLSTHGEKKRERQEKLNTLPQELENTSQRQTG